MSAILIVDSAVKSYDGKPVLQGASLRAVPGELRALVGTRGSGKSTLLKIAAGLIQTESGSVHFTGRTYRDMLRKDIARLGLFYLADANLLSSAWSIGLQLEMIRQQFDGANPSDALEQAGLINVADKRPDQLSSGQRRRAEVAAALVRRPRCVLIDDPYSGVSAADAIDLTRIFRGLAASGVAVVVGGYQMPELLGSADRVTWCTGGRTQEMGPPNAAARSPQFRLECLAGYSVPAARSIAQL
jgi:ABC-type multidrug transport system ATPase subunit